MYKEAENKENDSRWVYDIVNMDNRNQPKVIENGKISFCMRCHVGKKYARLFGQQ